MIKVILLVIYILQVLITYYLTKRFANYFFTPLTIISLCCSLLLIILVNVLVKRKECELNRLINEINMSSLYGNDKSAYILEVNHQKDRINRIAFYLCCLVVVIPISLTIYQEKRTVSINDVNDFIKIKYNLDGKYRLVSNINFDEYKPEVLSEVGCKDNLIFNGVF